MSNTEDIRHRISESMKAKWREPEFRTKRIQKYKEAAKRKIGKPGVRKGLPAWNSGKKGCFSKATLEKMRKSALGKRLKEKNGRWLGGKSFEPYSVDWTETLKISIRERDKYLCRNCFKPQGDIAHHVHHIDYNKTNCNPENLITLCHSCHGKTINNNRPYWIDYYKNLMKIT